MIARPRIRRLGLGELLDETFRLYRNYFLEFVAIVALVYVPYTLLSLVLQIPLQQQLVQLQTGPNAANPFAGQSAIDVFSSILFSTLGSIVLALLYTVVFQPLIEGALAHVISQRYLDQPTGVSDGFRVALRRAPALIGARLIPTLIGFVVFGVLLGGLVTITAVLFTESLNGDTGGRSANIAAVVILLGIGLFIVLAIAALFIFIRILFTSQAIVVEHQGAWSSISRSWQLTRGEFWRTFGSLLVIWLIVYFITLVPSIMVSVPVQLFLANNPALATVINSSVNAVVSVIVLPFSMIAYTLLYFDLRVRKEGFDLEQQTTSMLNTASPYMPGH